MIRKKNVLNSFVFIRVRSFFLFTQYRRRVNDFPDPNHLNSGLFAVP